MRRLRIAVALLVLLMILLNTACSAATPARNAPTSAEKPTLVPSNTPSPTATPLPTRTPGPTPTPYAMIVHPAAVDIKQVVISNPGKGWLLFDKAEDLYDHPEILELGTTGYGRFDWNDIEPEEGQYNWSVIDDRISAWKKVGKQFAFRVLAANTHAGKGDAGLYVTPKWVFDAGAASQYFNITPKNDYSGLPGPKIIPVWNDPIFKEKVQALVKALAERYDGSPDIAFIDIGTYGNWGEQHTWPFGGQMLNNNELQEHIGWYKQAFQHTQVISVIGDKQYAPVYDWCVKNGIGLRRDGLLGASPLGEEVAPAYDHVTGIFEWHRNYSDMIAGGYWSQEKFWKSLYTGRPSYQGTYWTPDPIGMYAKEGALMREAANRLGYHLLLDEASFPSSLGNGKTDTIKLVWTNEGIAPIYLPAVVKLALLDDQGTVLQMLVLDSVHPFDWKPKDQGVERYTNTVSFGFASQPGATRLAIGLFSSPSAPAPDIQLGVTGKLPSGWYPLDPSD